jgi:hypothetical protein
MALQETGSGRPGRRTAPAKLSELMFVEVIRCYIEPSRPRPAHGSRASVIRMSAMRCGSFMRAQPRGGPWTGWRAKQAYRARSSPSVSPTMKAFPPCTI